MRKIDCQQESENIISWIGNVFKESVQKKIVIGLSGGIDSSLSCALAVQAVGKENIIPLLLPYGDLSAKDLEDTRLVINYLQIPAEQVIEIDIKSGVDAIISKLNDVTDVRRGNSMARVRMIYLFDVAKQYKGLVCGTENKSEHYLGYFTRFGDEASDIEPIRHLYKTNVWEMAQHLKLPEKIISKAPTAGLWYGQTDEQEMGFSYRDADQFLYYFIDEELSVDEILQKGLDKVLVQNVRQRIKENEFKHKLPFIFKG